MKKKSISFNTFSKYFITYFSIVVIFGVFLGFVYSGTRSVIKSEIIEKDTQQMTRNIEDINTKIEKITIFSDFIPNIPAFEKLCKIQGELPADKYFYIINLQNELNSLRQQYDFDIQVFVIYKNNNVLVSNVRSSNNYSTVPENKYYNAAFLSNLREQIFSGNRGMKFLPSSELLSDSTATYLTCVVTDSLTPYDPIEYALVFNLDLQPLLSTFNINLSNNNSFLQIIDSERNVLLNYNYEGAAISPEDIAAHMTNISGQRYSLISSKTYYQNLDVIQGINNEVFSDKVSSIMTIIKFYVCFAILFSLAAALFFSYKQFFAIYKLFSIVKENSDLPFQKNELKYVEQSFLYAVNSQADYRREIQDQKRLIENTLLEKLFINGIYDENEKKELEKYLAIPIEFYAVVTIDLEIQSSAVLEQCNVIFSHIKEYIGEKYKFLSVTNGTHEMIILIHMDDSSEPTINDIYSFMYGMTGNIIEIFGIKIKVGISNIGYGISYANTCYMQTLHAIRQINTDFALPVNAFFEQNKIYNSPLESLNLEQQLYVLIAAGSSESVKDLFTKIKSRLQNFTFPDEQSIMQTFFDLRRPIQKAANTVLSEGEEISLANYRSDYSIEALLNELEQNSLFLTETSLKHKKSKNWALRESLLSYLAEEYKNPNLCAAMVADKFSLSEKYVFAFVKEQTGKSFGKYIESIRLDRVIELLKTTDANVNEIAQQVGFNSISTFYKTFNRVFGVSPAEWRKNFLS